MAYDETNRGAAWVEKEPRPQNGPQYTGKLNVEGKDYRIAVWVKTPKAGGDRFLSFQVEPWKAKKAGHTGPQGVEMDEANPFL